MLKHFSNILLLLVILFTSGLYAQPFSWELGVGVAGLDIPLYTGSAQSKQYILPVPYAKLESKYLELDDGVRSFFFKSDNVRLDVSLDLGVPVRSNDSAARKGMPNLDTVLQLGPSLEWTIAGKHKSKNELRLELPLRAAFSTDIKNVDGAGWLMESVLTYERKRQHKQGEAIKLSFGLRYATDDYHAYYYDVAPAFATASRHVFVSDSGYSGFFTDAFFGWREDSMIYWVFIRHQSLKNTVFENSPLVENKNDVFAGAGITWVFASNL